MHSLGKITKQFKLENTGPTDIAVEWKLYNLNNIGEIKDDLFKPPLAEPDPGTGHIAKLEWQPIPPKEATDGPFEITPKYLTWFAN